ncbi:hypothetical protein Patl1_23101 [Pistacia atlantica]|uniref:Uncharacterized protein n=1 Tax=Pistacia atlantica TaxID=434234 RepID=A0ACC0ZV53_9ROSI|nr:hypothetical protein Patl1_23101 [Pistacia atlantica]
MGQEEMVTPGEVLGKATEVKTGKGTYMAEHNGIAYASLIGLLRTVSPPPECPDQRPTAKVAGHKAHGPIPEPGSVVIAQVCEREIYRHNQGFYSCLAYTFKNGFRSSNA